MSGTAIAVRVISMREFGRSNKRTSAVLYKLSPPTVYVTGPSHAPARFTYDLVVIATSWPRKGPGTTFMYGCTQAPRLGLVMEHTLGYGVAVDNTPEHLLRRIGYEIDPIARAVLTEKIREGLR